MFYFMKLLLDSLVPRLSPSTLSFIRAILFTRILISSKGGEDPGRLYSRVDTDDAFNVHCV